MTCKWYAEFEGICCYGDCPECADICPYEDKQDECEYYKVIGNIHDNPELLKGDKSDA